MKKLVLFAAAIVAISFASCTNTSNNAETNQDTTAVSTPEAPAVEETPAVVEGDSAAVAVEAATEAAPAQ